MSINDNNNLEQRRNFIIQNLKMVQPYSGELEYLSMYVNNIETIVPNIATMPTDDKKLFFNCIIRTLQGEALNLFRREQPEDWLALKNLLIMEFGEHQSISYLILTLSNIRYKGSVKKLLEDINLQICRIKDAISLCNDTVERKLFFKNEADVQSLKILKRELPNHLVALLNANLVSDFKTARQILRQNDVSGEDIPRSSSKSQPKVSNSNTTTPNRYNSQYHNMNNYPLQNSYPQLYNQNFNSHNRNQNNYPQNFYDLNNQYQQNNYPRNFARVGGNNYNPNKRMRENDSNQSRIRKYGVPTPMEVENFHLKASTNYPPFQ